MIVLIIEILWDQGSKNVQANFFRITSAVFVRKFFVNLNISVLFFAIQNLIKKRFINQAKYA
jgi:hypothetical protein